MSKGKLSNILRTTVLKASKDWAKIKVHFQFKGERCGLRCGMPKVALKPENAAINGENPNNHTEKRQ